MLGAWLGGANQVFGAYPRGRDETFGRGGRAGSPRRRVTSVTPSPESWSRYAVRPLIVIASASAVPSTTGPSPHAQDRSVSVPASAAP